MCCAVLFVSAGRAPAQKTTKDTWKEFVSEEGGYKVKMPVTPTRIVSKVDMAFGKADVIQQRVITSTAAYIVSHVEFPSAIPDEEEIRARYELARDGLLGGGNRLVSERAVSLNNFAGKEFVFQNAQSITTVRMFIVNQRMFSLIAATQPAFKTKNQNLIDKFLDSFEVTKIPVAKFEAVLLPDDFGSKTTGNLYRSKFFDFSIELPPGWKILNEAELGLVREVVNNDADIENTRESKITKISLRRTAILISAVGAFGSNIMIGAERMDFANMTLETIMQVIKKNRLASKKEKIVKDIYTATIGGEQFSVIETRFEEADVQQRLYVAKRKDLIFQIALTYKSEDELQTMEKSLKTAKFGTNR